MSCVRYVNQSTQRQLLYMEMRHTEGVPLLLVVARKILTQH